VPRLWKAAPISETAAKRHTRAPAVEGDGSDGGSTTTAMADRRRQGRRIDGGRGEIIWAVWGTTATHD
jgi:hypothetical protein